MDLANLFRVRLTLALSLVGALLAGCEPPEPIYGSVEVADWQFADGPRIIDVYAAFVHGSRPDEEEAAEEACERTTVGACEAIRCAGGDSSFFDFDLTPPRPPPRLLDAGEVEVVIDGVPIPVSRDGASYWAELPAPLAAGQELRVTATGAEVDPFSIAGVAPGRPQLDVPTAIALSEGLTLTWEPPPGDPSMRVFVTSSIIHFGGSAHSEIICRPDAASGSVFIDPSAFERIDVDERGLWISTRYEAVRSTSAGVTEVDLRFAAHFATGYLPTR